MKNLTKQFDAAQYDPEWLTRGSQEDILEMDEDDGYVEHMKFECRQGRFV